MYTFVYRTFIKFILFCRGQALDSFVQWYNYEHHHSGLKFLTPDQRRSGKSQEILEKRHQVYEAAKEKYPERWNGRATRDWSLPDIVFTGDKH